MKGNKRIIQAVVVIVVVGIGSIHNLDKHSLIYQQLSTAAISSENNPNLPDSAQAKKTSLFIYTERIINSGIKHLIFNL